MIVTMFETPDIAQLKITIQSIEPPIWRRLLVPRSVTLAELHRVIQAAFGWLDSHLHEFEIGGLRFADPELLEGGFSEGSRVLPERAVRLWDFRHQAPPFLYVYDFGDDWHHQIEIETLLVADPDQTYPACIDGARSCPPEDVGGTGGYEEFLEAFADPNHPDHRQMRRWAGRSFDPERFDLAKNDLAVRRALGRRKRAPRTMLS